VCACGVHVCSIAVSLLRIPPLSGDYGQSPGLGLLRLHSTFRHDLKIYASDEGRVQMTAAAFAKVSWKHLSGLLCDNHFSFEFVGYCSLTTTEESQLCSAYATGCVHLNFWNIGAFYVRFNSRHCQ